MRTGLFAACLIVIGVSGCAPQGGASTSMWVARWSDAGSIPGIHQGSVEFLDIPVSGQAPVKVVIWSDLTEGTGSKESSLGKHRYLSNLKNADGSKKVTAEVDLGSISGSDTGTIKVGDKTLSLKDGHVILISTQKEAPIVEQIELDSGSEIWKIVGDANNAEDPQTELMIFAKKETRIGDFFKKQVPAADTEVKPADAASR